MIVQKWKCPKCGTERNRNDNIGKSVCMCEWKETHQDIYMELVSEKEYGECEFCKEPDELDWECPDDPMHGEDTECGECGATYYREYEGDIYTTNEQAKKNFPNLKSL